MVSWIVWANHLMNVETAAAELRNMFALGPLIDTASEHWWRHRLTSRMPDSLRAQIRERRGMLKPNVAAVDHPWPKQVLRQKVCECLGELGDRTFQEEVWTGRRPGIMSSYTECVEGLFTDSGLADAMGREGEVFGGAIDAELRAIDTLTRRMSRTGDVSPYDNPFLDQCAVHAGRALQLMHDNGWCPAP